MKIQYIAGDATQPIEMTPNKIIAHVVNNRCGWGKGFVLALSKRWPVDLKELSPEWKYRGGCDNYELGDIQMVATPEKGISVCNMFAQKDYRPLKYVDVELGIPNLNYSALYECLLRLRAHCQMTTVGKPSIHAPKIGSGLGHWPKIEGIINQVFENTPFGVYIYNND